MAELRTPYTLSIANQKGGVGKTTITVCLAEALAERDYEVLVIDYDGQANLTSWVYGQKLAQDDVNILDVLTREEWTLLNSADTAEDFGFDFIGATEDLFNLEAELSNDPYRIFSLRRAVEQMKSSQSEIPQSASDREYDFCLIDCPPALGLAVTQALNASDGVLIPTILEKMAIEGLKKLTDEVNQAQENGRSSVELVGVVPTIVQVVRKQTESIAEVLRERFGNDFLEDCQIPVRTKISEASAVSSPLRAYTRSQGSDEHEYFDRLAEAVAERTIATEKVA
jgi:chromosome partitioning protein